MKKDIKPTALILAFSILSTIFPIQSHAKWRDMSSNLPGYSSGPDPALALVVGGVVVAGGIYAIIKIKQHKKKIDEINRKAQSSLLHQTSASTGPSFVQSISSGDALSDNTEFSVSTKTDMVTEIRNAAQKLPVDFFVAPVSFSEKFDLTKTNGIQIGITIKF